MRRAGINVVLLVAGWCAGWWASARILGPPPAIPCADVDCGTVREDAVQAAFQRLLATYDNPSSER